MKQLPKLHKLPKLPKLMKLVTAPKESIQFVRQSREELKKVHWPTREQTIRYTIIVIVASLIVGLVTGGIDYVFTFILERVL